MEIYITLNEVELKYIVYRKQRRTNIISFFNASIAPNGKVLF